MANHDDNSSDARDLEAQSSNTRTAATSSPVRAKPVSMLPSCVVRVSHFLWCIVKVMFWSLSSISILTLFIIIRSDKIWGIQSYRLLLPYKENEKCEKVASIKRKRMAIKYILHERSIVTMARMGWVVLMWMVINLSVPSLRRVTFLGSLLWKWSLLVALILATYPLLIAPLHSEILIEAIGRGFSNHRINESNMAYCMMGLARSLTLLMYFTSILLAWLLFIDTKNPDLCHYGTLTLVSFLVGAVLSVVKSVVILLWKTKLIYNKYEGKILSAGCQLYFHLEIMGQKLPGSGILVQWWSLDDKHRKTKGKGWIEDESTEQRRKIPPIEEFLLGQGASLQHIHSVAKYLTNNFELSLTGNEDIPNIVPYLREKFASITQQPEEFTTSCQKSGLAPSDIDLLHELLKLGTTKKPPTYEDFEKWMVEGLKNCYAVGHRINGAMEVTRTLNRVLTGLIIAVVFLVWLFITGFATTRVVVGLGSIFIGLTFMFGEACKTFFLGVIFSFVNHPFDVADRCIIDNEELRVEKINILTTSFFRSKARETVIYPNSVLATKRIAILHEEPESELEPKPRPS